MKLNQKKAGVILSYTGMLLQSIISILYTPIMVRILGKSEFGLYNLVFSVVSYLGLFSFGFGSAYMRFYSRYKAKEDTNGIASLNGMFLMVFGAMSMISLLAGGALVFNVQNLFGGKLTENEISTARILLAIMVVNIALTFPASVFDCNVTAHERYFFQRMVTLLRSVLNPFLTLPLLLMGFKSVSLVVVTTILTIASLIINIWYCFTKLKTRFIFSKFNWGLLKEIWIFSFYIFLNMVVSQINWATDKFILSLVSGTGMVAVYSIGAQLNTYYMSFSNSISSVFIPHVNRIVAQTNDNTVLTQVFTKVGRIQLIILSPIAMGLIFFGQPFIKMWAGSGYEDAYGIMLCLILSELIPLFQDLGIEIQKAKNMHRFRSILYCLIAIGNILISIPLAKAFGGFGAAMGTAFAMLIGNILIMNWYYQAKIGLDMKYFWKQIIQFFPAFILPTATGIVIMLFANLYHLPTFFLCITIFIIIFAGSFWMFGLNSYEKGLFLQPIYRITHKIKPHNR